MFLADTVIALKPFRSGQSASKVFPRGWLVLLLFLGFEIRQFSYLTSLVPAEQLSQFFRVGNTFREGIHFIRGNVVREVVVFDVVDRQVPVSPVVFISSSEVDSIHLIVLRNQKFTVHFHVTVSRVFSSNGGHTGANLRDVDVLLRVSDGVSNTEVLVVSVSPHLHADDVLVTLHKSTEATSGLTLEG